MNGSEPLTREDFLSMCIVCGVLVIGYVIFGKIAWKLKYLFSVDRKCDKARAQGNMVKGTLFKSCTEEDVDRDNNGDVQRRVYTARGWYKYTLPDGVERTMKARFRGARRAPNAITIYYDENGRVFSNEVTNREFLSNLLFLCCFAGPWLMATYVYCRLGLYHE